jgi:glycosyltransferase involved in cell wall biosynthesis
MTDISVLTPSFGYGRFIRDNILSVQRQDGVSVQHIVQDAESSDETLDVLREFGDAIDWASEPDEGQSDALNRALARATGRWIAWLNADEFYLPGALRTLIGWGEDKKADVVYADNVFVDGHGRMLRLLPQHRFSPNVLRLYGCFIASSSIVIRRSALGDSPWDPSLKMMMDWELYLSLMSRGANFVDLVYPVGAFRRHDDRVTARPSSDFADEYARVFARYGISKGSRRWGRWLHGGYKLISGSYTRQLRARSIHGHDLRWFVDGEGFKNSVQLFATCYGQRTTGGPG